MSGEYWGIIACIAVNAVITIVAGRDIQRALEAIDRYMETNNRRHRGHDALIEKNSDDIAALKADRPN